MRIKTLLAVASACFFIACSGATDNNKGNGNTNAKPATPTPTTPPAGSGVTIGQFQMGGESLPDWFPVYPGVDKKDMMVLPLRGEVEMISGSFGTPDAPEKVIEFYTDALKQLGYDVKPVKDSHGPKIEAKIKGREVSVDASAKDGKTTAGFSIVEKKK